MPPRAARPARQPGPLRQPQSVPAPRLHTAFLVLAVAVFLPPLAVVTIALIGIVAVVAGPVLLIMAVGFVLTLCLAPRRAVQGRRGSRSRAPRL